MLVGRAVVEPDDNLDAGVGRRAVSDEVNPAIPVSRSPSPSMSANAAAVDQLASERASIRYRTQVPFQVAGCFHHQMPACGSVDTFQSLPPANHNVHEPIAVDVPGRLAVGP